MKFLLSLALILALAPSLRAQQLADVVIAVDGSGSMVAEAAAVQSALAGFSTTIGSQGVDLHVIVISRSGSLSTGICAPAPLGSGACPADEHLPGYRHVIDSTISSLNVFARILATYPSWSGSLRAGASRTLVAVTDDNDATSSTTFQTQLLALDPGFTGFRFDAIVGTSCPLVNPTGTQYINLANQTSGIVSDLCQLNNIPIGFTAIANQVIAGSTCAPGCSSASVGNGTCDSACNVAACNFDGGDCNCAPGCSAASVGNGTCDSACNVAGCSFDLGDCNCAPGCSAASVGNATCDSACNVAACGYDAGDCDCAQSCSPGSLGNAICDSTCNVPGCGYDAGDCSLGADPADVIIALDTSGSMVEETAVIRANLTNFAAAIAGSGVDLHLVLIADPNSICVAPPLGSGTCPADGSLPSYRHVPVTVGSLNALETILASHSSWSASLRPGSSRTIVVVTDDNSNLSAASFQTQLLALDPEFQGYRFHALIHATCPVIGAQYLSLAALTSGVVKNLCSQDTGTALQQLAPEVVADSASQIPAFSALGLAMLGAALAFTMAWLLSRRTPQR